MTNNERMMETSEPNQGKAFCLSFSVTCSCLFMAFSLWDTTDDRVPDFKKPAEDRLVVIESLVMCRILPFSSKTLYCLPAESGGDQYTFK